MASLEQHAAALAAAARAYAERGWPVAPTWWIAPNGHCACPRGRLGLSCQSAGKHPLTENGLSDATTDPVAVARWWAEHPHASILVATGSRSGFDVLDVDGEDGEAGLAALVAEHGPLPDTVEQLTGGGGRHLLFQHAPGVTNSRGALPNGIDVRGEGGYILVDPSKHISGRCYRWEVDHHPEECALAPWPGWLLAKVLNRPKAQEATEGADSPIPEGKRNARLTSIGGAARRQGASEPAILAMLSEINRARCTPPLEDDELRLIAASVCRYQPSPDPAILKMGGNGSGAAGPKPLGDGTYQAEDFEKDSRPAPPQYQRVTAADLRAAYSPTTWTVDAILPTAGTAMVAGIPGLGKTWMGLTMALAVVRGDPWLGQYPTLQGPALLVLEEEHRSAVLERLDLLYRGAGLSPEQGDRLPVHFLIQQGVQILTPDGKGGANLNAELLRHIQEVKPALVTLDPFRRLHCADENDSAEMSLLFQRLREVSEAEGCSFLLTHHLKKRSRNDLGGPLDWVRGSTDIAASVDSMLELAGSWGYWRLSQEKSKRGPAVGGFVAVAETDPRDWEPTKQKEARLVSLRLRWRSPEEEAEKLESEKSRAVEAVRAALADRGPVGKNELQRLLKAEHVGRTNLADALACLVDSGVALKTSGPRGATLYSLAENLLQFPDPQGEQ